jgi:hypothetical protein
LVTRRLHDVLPVLDDENRRVVTWKIRESRSLGVVRRKSSSRRRVVSILSVAIRRLSVAAFVTFVWTARSTSASRARCLKRSCSSAVACSMLKRSMNSLI